MIYRNKLRMIFKAFALMIYNGYAVDFNTQQHDQVRAATQFNYRTALRANRGFGIPVYITTHN